MSKRLVVDLSFFEVLTLIFIVLKLGNVIDWSWLWVLSPIVLPIIFGLTVLFFAFLFDKYN